MTSSKEEKAIEIWTDGACKGNPGVGGWGVLLKWGRHEKELFGGELLTTNNRMEITAVIKALEAIKRPSRVVIHTDSQYVKNAMTKWLDGWKQNNWRTSNRKPVKNTDLWQHLDSLVQIHDVTWQWVRGHTGNPGNERADALANKGVEQLTCK